MLEIKEASGLSRGLLVNYTNLTRFWTLNERLEVSFNSFRQGHEGNDYAFDTIDVESSVVLQGDVYRIKNVKKRFSEGTEYRLVHATHEFYAVMIDQPFHEELTGTYEIGFIIGKLFNGTKFSFSIEGEFGKLTWENLGMENKSAIFDKVIKRHNAEYDIQGTHVTIKHRIGRLTQNIFRYNYNVEGVEIDIDTDNLTTAIRGYGHKSEEGSWAFPPFNYISPKAEKWGQRWADPVIDGRYHDAESMLNRLKSEIQDEPIVSVSFNYRQSKRFIFSNSDIETLQRGEWWSFAHEPLDFFAEVRMISITDYPDDPTRSPQVELSNKRADINRYNITLNKELRDLARQRYR